MCVASCLSRTVTVDKLISHEFTILSGHHTSDRHYHSVSYSSDRDAFRLRLAALDVGFEGVDHDANDVKK